MNLKEKARQLPARPGVYFMVDSHDQLLYIGKAKRLNKRVISYFIPSTPQSKKNQRMIFHIADFSYQTVDTELEALLLEQQLIAKLHPPYNRLMNYAERYRYLIFTDQQFTISKEPTAEAYGPFSQYKRLPEVIRVLIELYDLPSSRWRLPAARELHQKRQSLLPQLSHELKNHEIKQTLLGGGAALEKINYQQSKALEILAFEWAKSLEEDKEILRRFQKQALTLHKILAPKPRIIADEIDADTTKAFLVFQGKLLAEKKLPTKQFTTNITEFENFPLPPVEHFIPFNELDNRLIVASYFDKVQVMIKKDK
ncbi:GIY-YIG nuclease family protein [Enterococcus sp. HY326]|uniref:GIY-YIG nuclease family protein n=1 Tax=Enterococcus sp. HY326 TaxID=2971265 RepID=UPI00223F7A12|nr:GIY-YIG nuclease family protein [Enterococcus sp. HY326]